MDHSFYEFCDKAEKAKEKGKGLKLPRYEKNLRYDSEGIYSYGTKIANLDLGRRTVYKLGYWSPTSNRHYNYAAGLLNKLGIHEVEPESVHVQNLSYDDHT